MGEQHLDLFAHPSRCLTLPRFCNLARHVARTLMDRTGDSSSRRVGAALELETASCAVAFTGAVKDRRIVIHQSARRGQLLAAGADVGIALVVIVKPTAGEWRVFAG